MATEKLTSCQLHFKKDLLKQLQNIGESYRDEFYQIGCQLCSAPTVAKYNELNKLLLEFADIFPAIKPWLDFGMLGSIMFPSIQKIWVHRCHFS